MEQIGCTKYILGAFNLLFLVSFFIEKKRLKTNIVFSLQLTGIILIIVGNNVSENFSDYTTFLVSEYFDLSLAIIILGAVVIILTIVNCWTILKQKYNLNLLFCVLLGITAILSLTAGGLGFKLKSHTKGLIEVPMAQSMLEYQPNVYNEHTVMWDYLQKSVSL